MAALLNFFKQAWTSIVKVFTGCSSKSDEAPTTTTLDISTAVDSETTTITTLDTELISSGGGGKTHADLLGAELNTSSGTGEKDILATSMISSGGGGHTHDTTL
ncbi:uncharacterized protein LOC111919498 [Lactuca sativa]|uniref:Uncharacterized protein n=1 Tax=Lactuca sativa TaxID=4236 RepID=A0A9R1UCD6_LACSA|nr:uncharacterized protein LOC111919498 [Lactuca sativa]KAJ0184574.1 hypothetical protein LSAT_V11C900471540 [Lactuca sativa]